MSDPQPAIDKLLHDIREHLPHRPKPAELQAVVDAGGLIVDIRPDDLRQRDGVMPGALIVGRNVLEWRLDPTSPDRLPQVTGPDQPMVLFCEQGYASSLAAETLQRIGLREATDLDGGFEEWLKWDGLRRDS